MMTFPTLPIRRIVYKPMEDSQFWVVAGSLGVFALLYFLNRRKTEEIAEPARPVAAIKRDLTLE